MLNFRPTYKPLIKFCKELIAEKKVLMEENEELKEMLESTRQDLFYARGQNRFLSESLADLQNEKRKDLEKRAADLERRLNPPELRGERAEEKLEVGKWYHTTDFTQEELTKLLPKGTTVLVERGVLYDNIEKEPPTSTMAGKVVEITEGLYYESPLINIGSRFNKEWFKIIEE